jgi:hypothetical protein
MRRSREVPASGGRALETATESVPVPSGDPLELLPARTRAVLVLRANGMQMTLHRGGPRDQPPYGLRAPPAGPGDPDAGGPEQLGARLTIVQLGKSWLGEAFAERACRTGYSAYCVRAPRLFHELHVARGDGSYTRVLARLAKTDLLVIDDWALAPLTATEDRAERASTLITSQVPVKAWHELHLRSARPHRLPPRAPGPLPARDPGRAQQGSACGGDVDPPAATRPSRLAPESGREGRDRGPANRQETLQATISRGGATLLSPLRALDRLARRSERGDNRAGVAPLRRAITIIGTRDHDPPD